MSEAPSLPYHIPFYNQASTCRSPPPSIRLHNNPVPPTYHPTSDRVSSTLLSFSKSIAVSLSRRTHSLSLFFHPRLPLFLVSHCRFSLPHLRHCCRGTQRKRDRQVGGSQLPLTLDRCRSTLGDLSFDLVWVWHRFLWSTRASSRTSTNGFEASHPLTLVDITQLNPHPSSKQPLTVSGKIKINAHAQALSLPYGCRHHLSRSCHPD